MEEVWKELDGFDKGYLISSHGNIKNTKPYISKINKEFIRDRVLKGIINSKGYFNINLYKDKKMYVRTVHRLVATAFIPNAEKKPQINHINGIKTDNRVENLEWVTSKENVIHYYKYIYNGERKGKHYNCGNSNSANLYIITVTNKSTNETTTFSNLSTASIFIGKKSNYFSNWIYKNKLNYHNKNHNWVIKENTN